MNKKSKVTKIDKKYKDKKTGEWKTLTIHYSKVADRLKEFRQDCPNGLIKTTPIFKEGGQIMFSTTIIKDKSNPSSGEATGHALGTSKGDKEFEKLETISVGRALKLLGYGDDGEIASSEEMEEFNKYKEEQKEKQIEDSCEKILSCKSLDELKTLWVKLGSSIQNKRVVDAKDKMKELFLTNK